MRLSQASRIEHPELSRYRRSTFVKIVLLVLAGTIAATAYIQWRLRAEAINHQLDAAMMFARNFEDHLTLSFRALDITLKYVAFKDHERWHFPDDISGPYLRSIALLDMERKAIVSSSNPSNVGAQIALTEFLPTTPGYLELLRAGPPWSGRDFHAGRPATAEHPVPSDRTSFFAVMRDVPLGEEAWATLVAAINPDYFLNYYTQNVLPGTGTVELLRYDGMRLLSTDPARQIGQFASSDAIIEQIEQVESGRFERLEPDGKQVLLAYRASKNYPFIVVVRLDKDHALAGWQREAQRTTASVALVLLVALSVTGGYYRRLERLARERELVEADLRLRSAALGAAANAIVITDRTGLVKWANPAFCQLSGYTLNETLGHNMRELSKSGRQPREYYAEVWGTILAGKVWHGELVNRRKDGSLFHEDQTITPVLDADGAIREFIAVKQDITERKINEARLEDLSRRLVSLQEESRRRLSGELHDRTSPNLAAIRINLDTLAAGLSAERATGLAARLEDTRALIEDTAASIREVCNDLRPAVLDYAGLSAALDSYAEQFARRTDVAVRIDCPLGAERLPPEMETVLFRVAQEALTNCAKHARASSVALSLRQTGSTVVLEVADDGVGFVSGSGRGLGLIIMQELVELAGGKFAVATQPGQGTRIRAEVEVGDMPE